jgi:hypothetical protein
MSNGNPLGLPPVDAPPGHYAVEDPDIRGRLTAWHVDGKGRLHRFGAERWEPVPPLFGHITVPAQRRDARDDWYANEYRDWKVAVIDAISADPQKAAAAFAKAYPVTAAETAVVQRQRADKQAKLFAEDVIAAALASLGLTVSATARNTGVTRRTVRDRIAAGRELATDQPEIVRSIVADRLALGAREFLPFADVRPVDLDALIALASQDTAPDDPAR